MKHDILQLRMRTLTYLILTYLDKYYATYGYHPRFDLIRVGYLTKPEPGNARRAHGFVHPKL